MMDDADFRLLAHLFRDPFASYRELGQELALSGPAARNRLERLAESGVLRGFQVLPSAEVMGRTHVMWEYPEPRERPESSKVLTIEDVAWAVEWHDNSWTVHAFVRRPRERPPATLDALMGAPGRAAHPLAETDPGVADPDAVLSPLDWRLIAALATEPRATAVRLAQESGLSPKSVRARRAALVERGRLQVIPRVAYAASRGVILFDLLVMLSRPADEPSIRRMIPTGVLLRANRSPPSGFFFCRADSVHAISDLERRVAGLPGVSRVVSRFPKSREYAGDRIRAWVDAKNEEWAQARRPRPVPPATQG
ncbi:MAG TPA: AsnC family transcriptional regulator [Thermoplasmata archaeon]|nr:AsnC family transcriptional regulator [Thermoplasmata archaeon]